MTVRDPAQNSGQLGGKRGDEIELPVLDSPKAL